MKTKTTVLIFLSLGGLTLGLSFGFILEEYFLYSKIVFTTIMAAYFLDIILSLAPALNAKNHKELFEIFAYRMSKTFHPLIQRLKIKSLPIIGIVFGFSGYLMYFEYQNFWLPILFLSIPALSYFRALESYQKLGEFT